MTCKDCIYYEVCADFRRNICDTDRKRFEEYRMNSDGLCDNFKDKNGVIVPPCKVGDTVYLIYRGEVTQGTVRLIRPFVSEQETIFKGNIICEVDNLFIDDGTKEEHELYVVFEKPYGIERVAYLTHEEAEKALAERSNDGKS